MNGRRFSAVGAAVAVVATAAVGLGGLAGGSGHSDDALDQIRDATSTFRSVERAVDHGYVQFFGCVHEPLAGAMGIHFVNGELAGDTVIDASRPEAVMYEVKENGTLKLVGVEYIVFQAAWDTGSTATRPSCSASRSTSSPSPTASVSRLSTTARVGVEAQPDRPAPGLEPAGALPGHRRSHALTVSDPHGMPPVDASDVVAIRTRSIGVRDSYCRMVVGHG